VHVSAANRAWNVAWGAARTRSLLSMRSGAQHGPVAEAGALRCGPDPIQWTISLS
jgi:hypothetical protein